MMQVPDIPDGMTMRRVMLAFDQWELPQILRCN